MNCAAAGPRGCWAVRRLGFGGGALSGTVSAPAQQLLKSISRLSPRSVPDSGQLVGAQNSLIRGNVSHLRDRYRCIPSHIGVETRKVLCRTQNHGVIDMAPKKKKKAKAPRPARAKKAARRPAKKAAALQAKHDGPSQDGAGQESRDCRR